MYRSVAFGFLLVLASTATQAQGITARNSAETLKGLDGVHVIVEDLPPEALEAGLTTAGVKTAVESRLIGRGVPALGLGALAMDPRSPTLLVKVRMDFSDPVYFFNAQIQFFQNVHLEAGGEVITSVASASTWQADRFDRIGKFRVNTLAQEINKMIDAFAADYLRFNEGIAPVEETVDSTATAEADTTAG